MIETAFFNIENFIFSYQQRLKIQKDWRKSATFGSIITTSISNSQRFPVLFVDNIIWPTYLRQCLETRSWKISIERKSNLRICRQTIKCSVLFYLFTFFLKLYIYVTKRWKQNKMDWTIYTLYSYSLDKKKPTVHHFI